MVLVEVDLRAHIFIRVELLQELLKNGLIIGRILLLLLLELLHLDALQLVHAFGFLLLADQNRVVLDVLLLQLVVHRRNVLQVVADETVARLEHVAEVRPHRERLVVRHPRNRHEDALEAQRLQRSVVRPLVTVLLGVDHQELALVVVERHDLNLSLELEVLLAGHLVQVQRVGVQKFDHLRDLLHN